MSTETPVIAGGSVLSEAPQVVRPAAPAEAVAAVAPASPAVQRVAPKAARRRAMRRGVDIVTKHY